MKQLKVGLPDDVRARLEEAAAVSGKGLAEEIRDRLELSFSDPQTRALANAIDRLATLVRLQTGHAWHSHSGANRVLRHAITARLSRLKPPGEASFRSDELPRARLVASDDIEAMGLGIEAIDFSSPPLTTERRRQLDEWHEKLRQELLAQQQQDKGGRS